MLMPFWETIADTGPSWGDPEIYLSLIAAIAGVVVIMIQLARWLQGKYRKFEVRFLNPCKPVMRQGEKRATCISLPVGASTIRLRLKPTISLNQGTGFAFSAYDNPMLIQRILGMVGRDTPSDSIVAKRVRFRKPDGSWSDDLEAFATQRGSHIDAEIPLRKGSRLSLEIDLRWTGLSEQQWS